LLIPAFMMFISIHFYKSASNLVSLNHLFVKAQLNGGH